MPLDAIICVIELPVPGSKWIPFKNMSTKQLRLVLFSSDEDRSAANSSTGSHFGGLRSIHWPEIYNGVSCTMPFLVLLSDVKDGRKMALQTVHTAKPLEKISALCGPVP
ncbi:hypothetical protein BGZ93_001306 [Podila epicladia]|nr:hypothetical protein BGZ93_001306 [Podila epicladia]